MTFKPLEHYDESGKLVYVDHKRLVNVETNEVSHAMCCMCFNYIPLDECWMDDDGFWDCCVPCMEANIQLKKDIDEGNIKMVHLCPRCSSPVEFLDTDRVWCTCGWVGTVNG